MAELVQKGTISAEEAMRKSEAWNAKNKVEKKKAQHKKMVENIENKTLEKMERGTWEGGMEKTSKRSEKTQKAVQIKLEEIRARGKFTKPPEDEGKKAKRIRLLAQKEFLKECKEYKLLRDKVAGGSYPSRFSIGKLTNNKEAAGNNPPEAAEAKKGYKLRPGLNQPLSQAARQKLQQQQMGEQLLRLKGANPQLGFQHDAESGQLQPGAEIYEL